MKAVPLAEDGKLVTFGIVPTEPHTGYGYIEAGSSVGCAFEVSSFKEKPTLMMPLATSLTEVTTGIVVCSCLRRAASSLS